MYLPSHCVVMSVPDSISIIVVHGSVKSSQSAECHHNVNSDSFDQWDTYNGPIRGQYKVTWSVSTNESPRMSRDWPWHLIPVPGRENVKHSGSVCHNVSSQGRMCRHSVLMRQMVSSEQLEMFLRRTISTQAIWHGGRYWNVTHSIIKLYLTYFTGAH